MKTSPALTDFLNLSVGSATDAYLRELALIAIQSRYLAQTVEQLSAYQRSACQSSFIETEASKGELIEGRYLVGHDGTVTDQQTRLMWMRSSLEDTFTFEQSQQAAKNLNVKRFAGHADWRVPSQDELLSLVMEGSCPSICQEAFPDTPDGWFWSSTPHAENAAEAWVVYFNNGCTFDLNQRYYGHVRLVR
ncbi:MAG: Lcl C-terminal domain-containing protein [Polaromonas sp.]